MTYGTYIHIEEISIDITSVGLALARPNYVIWKISELYRTFTLLGILHRAL